MPLTARKGRWCKVRERQDQLKALGQACRQILLPGACDELYRDRQALGRDGNGQGHHWQPEEAAGTVNDVMALTTAVIFGFVPTSTALDRGGRKGMADVFRTSAPHGANLFDINAKSAGVVFEAVNLHFPASL